MRGKPRLPDPMGEELFAVAEVTKVFGVRGELVVSLFSESTRLRRNEKVHIGPDEDHAIPHRIDHVTAGVRGVRIALVGIESREGAAKLVGFLVFVGKPDLRELRPGEFFVHDLIGMKVIEESGKEIGVLKSVLKMPAQDVYVVAHGGRETLIPAVKEFVREISPRKGIIVVRLIEGLREP